MELKGKTVLVVDDECGIRTVMCELMKQIGAAEVISAADGEEALEAVKAGNVDLVVTDWQMPKLDGLGFTCLLRRGEAGEKKKATKILFVSAGGEYIFAEAKKFGADACVAKPFEIKNFAKAIKNL